MDASLLIYLVIFLVVVFLIFKLIKKIIVAIFAVVFIVVAIFGGIGAMLYFDYQDIVEKDNFSVNLVYGDIDNADFGVILPFEQQKVVEENIKSLDVSSLDEKKIDDVTDEFYVFIDEDLFGKVLTDDKNYTLKGTEGLEFAGVKINTDLTKEEILNLVNSKNAQDDYVDLILEKNDLSSLKALGAEDIASGTIEKELKGVDFRAVLVLSVLSDLDSDGMKALILGFKEEELNVYPEKFSFKFLRMLPLDFLVEKLSVEQVNKTQE